MVNQADNGHVHNDYFYTFIDRIAIILGYMSCIMLTKLSLSIVKNGAKLDELIEHKDLEEVPIEEIETNHPQDYDVIDSKNESYSDTKNLYICSNFEEDSDGVQIDTDKSRSDRRMLQEKGRDTDKFSLGQSRTSFTQSIDDEDEFNSGVLELVKNNIFVSKINVKIEEDLNEILVHRDFRMESFVDGPMI